MQRKRLAAYRFIAFCSSSIGSIGSDERIAIDLPKQHVTVKQTVYPFEIDATWKHKLVNGLDEIGITLQEEEKSLLMKKQSSLSPQLKDRIARC